MMSEETRQWVRRIFGAGLGIVGEVLRDQGEDSAAVLVDQLAPGIVERILDEVIDESVELRVGPDATASGVVDFGD